MFRFALVLLALTAAASAAPVPSERPAGTLVAGLSDPSDAVRDASATALRGRVDARPWLRRAAQSADKDTARRAAALLAPHDETRQALVPKAIDACIRDGRADLFMEWYHFWQPKEKVLLWPLGPLMGQSALGAYAKALEQGKDNALADAIASTSNPAGNIVYGHLDGDTEGSVNFARCNFWHVRTNRCYDTRTNFAQLGVDGPIYEYDLGGAYFYALGRFTPTASPAQSCSAKDRPRASHTRASRAWSVPAGRTSIIVSSSVGATSAWTTSAGRSCSSMEISI